MISNGLDKPLSSLCDGHCNNLGLVSSVSDESSLLLVPEPEPEPSVVGDGSSVPSRPTTLAARGSRGLEKPSVAGSSEVVMASSLRSNPRTPDRPLGGYLSLLVVYVRDVQRCCMTEVIDNFVRFTPA